MAQAVRSVSWLVTVLLQRLAMLAILVATVTVAAWTIAAALGQAPWLQTTITIGDVQYPEAGMVLQLVVLFLLVSLMVYLPSNRRILALETSHRQFHMTMGDVARAYALAHEEDRRGNFQMSAEFDSIRERIQFLRRHPDLETLEAPVIEAAAQMSHISRELANTYSERNLARARDFLTARQQELADFEDRLVQAREAADEVARWTRDVELEEAIAESRLDQLRETLADILPEFSQGDAAETPADAPALPAPTAAELRRQDAASRETGKVIQRATHKAMDAAEAKAVARRLMDELDRKEAMERETNNIVALKSSRGGNRAG